MFYYAQEQSDKQVTSALDNGSYNEADLITIKVPLSNPYQLDHPEFERVDGEINVKGVIYKYVKRKITDGQLVLLCLPDKNKMRLQKAKDDFFKVTNDLVQHSRSKNSQSSKNAGLKNIYSDYEQSYHEFPLSFYLNQHASIGLYLGQRPISTPHISPEQPPDMA